VLCSDPKAEGLNYKYYSMDRGAFEHHARVFAIGNPASLWRDVKMQQKRYEFALAATQGHSFMWYSVRITVHHGDGVHSITVSQKTSAEIRGGKEITLQGDGFALEEGTVADYWEFNTDTVGSVRVFCDNGRQLFRGDGWLSAERVSQ
jgi:hypothetical protein